MSALTSPFSDALNCYPHLWAQNQEEKKDKAPFVSVVNEGSAQFANLDLGTHARRIDFRSTARAVIDKAKKEDRLRGNFQMNLMFSGGENQRRGLVEITDHYGCAMPGRNIDSDKWIHLAVEMSFIARKVCIPWVVNPDETLKMRNKIFAQRLHPDNVFEGITIALLELFPNPGKVNEHVDGLNCFVYTHTLLFSSIVNFSLKIYRVLILGYMRKTCYDSMIRRTACEELAGACTSYMRTASLSQRPGMTPSSYKPFYEDIGSMGLGLMVERSSEMGLLSIHYAALLHRPHVNKAMSYLSPIATSICKVYQKHRSLSYIDLLSMCLPVAHLCGFYSYLFVLDNLSEDVTLRSDPDIGLLERIMTDLVDWVGCYSGGGFRRHQCSYNSSTANRQRLASELLLLRGMCLNSTESPPKGRTYEQHCQERYCRYLETVRSGIKGAGDLTGTHLIGVLVQVGVLKPVGMVHCSKFATATTLFKQRKGVEVQNPRVREYINSCPSSTAASASTKAARSNNCLKAERAQRLMESVLPHLRLKFPFMERSFVEQINCETYRRDVVYDFFGPGTTHAFVYPFASTQVPGLHTVRPELNVSTGLISVCTSPQAPHTDRVSSASIIRYKNDDDIPLSRANGKSCKRTTFVRIPMEYINSFPGLRKDLLGHFLVTIDSNGKRHIPSTRSVTTWIADHPILSKLLRRFFNYPLPKSMPLTSVRARSFDNAAQRKGFRSPEQLLYDYASGIYSAQNHTEFTGDITTDKYSKPVGSLPADGKPGDDFQDNTDKKGVLKTFTPASPSPKRQKLCHDFDQDAHSPVKSANVDVPDFSGSETIDFPACPKPMSIYDNISFKSYKIHGDKGLDVVCKKGTGMPQLRKMLIRPSGVLTLSPLHAEVKQCVYHGLKSSSMPTVFSKGCFIAVKCTNLTHVFQFDKPLESPCIPGKETALYMTRLFGYDQCQFYTVGVCSLIDKLAASVGARAAHSRAVPGMVNWLFETVEASNKFFVQATMILSGKPSYFQSLYYRMMKIVRSGTTVGVDIGKVVIHLCLPDDGGCLFYAVLQPPHGRHADNWCVVPVASDPAKGSELLYVDCWSWKSHDELQVSPTCASTQTNNNNRTPYTI